MGFNLDKFMSIKWERRTYDFPIPSSLSVCFDNPKKDKRVMVIQSLSGDEIGQAKDAVLSEPMLKKVMTALMSQNDPKVIKQIEELTGHADDKSKSMKEKIYHLMFGCADPKFTLEQAVKFCEVQVILFLNITTKILELTGEGWQPGKLTPSIETKK